MAMLQFWLFLPLVILPGLLFLMTFPDSTDTRKRLKLSEEDYAVGSKRAAAVFAEVTPGLKEAFAAKELEWGAPIFIRAFKEERELELWVQKGETFTLFRKYHVAGISGEAGPKLRQGDGQIPEGFYFVTPGQMNPQSNFHLSFNIGYPNQYDRLHERTGDFIMVHGSDVSVGCLAMTDEKIEEIYTLAHAAFQGGQKFFRVHLFPFHLTDAKLALWKENHWHSFWENLRGGYQWFEEKKVPPNVTVGDNRYHFD